MNNSSVVLLDNGAFTVKAGILGVHDDRPLIIPNSIVRSKGDNSTYVGHELAKCRDFTSLRYRLPFEKGFLVDWDAQKAVWDGIFSSEVLGVNTSEASLLITEPYFNLPNIQDVYDQFVFEEYDFQAYHRCTPASLIPYGHLLAQPGLPRPECLLVIDSGFSFTHVVPIMNSAVVWSAVKRIDVGGKLLTNHLKEVISFRQWNLMEETHIVNEVKEACCFVSEDFARDLEACRGQPGDNPIVQEYIFPDYSSKRPGRIRRPGEPLDASCQTLIMNNERFTIPEILFHPADIGLNQAGVSAAVAESVSLLPEDLRGMFWANIVLIGGNTALPGFRQRLVTELRSLAPIDCEVVVYSSENPALEAYHSAVAFASRPDFTQHVVTREDYQEMGSNGCRRKFRDWRPMEEEASRGREYSNARGQEAGLDTEKEDTAPTTRKSTRGRGRARGNAKRQT